MVYYINIFVLGKWQQKVFANHIIILVKFYLILKFLKIVEIIHKFRASILEILKGCSIQFFFLFLICFSPVLMYLNFSKQMELKNEINWYDLPILDFFDLREEKGTFFFDSFSAFAEKEMWSCASFSLF